MAGLFVEHFGFEFGELPGPTGFELVLFLHLRPEHVTSIAGGRVGRLRVRVHLVFVDVAEFDLAFGVIEEVDVWNDPALADGDAGAELRGQREFTAALIHDPLEDTIPRRGRNVVAFFLTVEFNLLPVRALFAFDRCNHGLEQVQGERRPLLPRHTGAVRLFPLLVRESGPLFLSGVAALRMKVDRFLEPLPQACDELIVPHLENARWLLNRRGVRVRGLRVFARCDGFVSH
jgi:hypothetical protein